MGGHTRYSAMKEKEKENIARPDSETERLFTRDDEEVDGEMIDDSGGKYDSPQNWSCRLYFFIVNFKTLTNY